MGMYSNICKVTFGWKWFWRVAKVHNLPTGRIPDNTDYVRQLNVTEVRLWVNAAEETPDRELYFMAQCMYRHALDYLNEAVKAAPEGPHSVRKRFLQRASKKYRFTFV